MKPWRIGMRCPRCGKADLELKVHKGIEVDRCPQCEGLWLDHHELDALEDHAIAEDGLKGTLMYAKREGQASCPKCGQSMTEFNYRGHDLPIDVCPEGHGYWLDKGEDKRVLELLEQRVRDLGRSVNAQKAWRRAVRGEQRSLLARVKGWFQG